MTRILLILASFAGAVTAQVGGDYSGMLGPLHVRVHVKGANGSYACTLDSMDQGAMGLPCGTITVTGDAVSFDVPSVNGKWKGTASADGATLTGTWSQGQEIPLTLHRDAAFEPAEKPSAVDGIWLGTLDVGGAAKLRLQLHIKSDRRGNEYCTADSPDQGGFGIACDKAEFKDNQFSFSIDSIRASFMGKLSADGKHLAGTFTQGRPIPLDLERQEKAIEPPPPAPKPVYDPTPNPVTLPELKAVLDGDLANALASGSLAHKTGAAIVIGVYQKGKQELYSYGSASQDTMFELGSVTKTFTGLLLARLVEKRIVRVDEPVRDFLPADKLPAKAESEITLLDLVTQHSGLPRMPDNFEPADPANPYADYSADKLYAYIAKHGLGKIAGAPFGYSNLGMGLLGQSLANAANMSYPDLLRREITAPLGMKDTGVNLSEAQMKRMAQAYSGAGIPAHMWDLTGLAGAGAIRSTAGDMLKYLEAELHPDQSPFAAAIKMSQELRADAGLMKIAFAWFFNKETGTYWHNGATGGYSSFAVFKPSRDYAYVVLFNRTVSNTGVSIADIVGEHIGERLTGRPAVEVD